MHNFAANLERNGPVFRDVHPADRIAHQPPRTKGGLLSGCWHALLTGERIQESAQHPGNKASQHCHGPEQYHQPNQKSHNPGRKLIVCVGSCCHRMQG